MQNLKTAIALFLLLLFSFSLLGCGGPKIKEEDLVGKWTAVKKTVPGLGSGLGLVIEFFPDKTVSLPSGKGTWAIMGDGRVKIKIYQTTMFGSLAKNLLTINYPDNRGALIFKKK